MSLTRKLASSVSLLNGVWGLVVGLFAGVWFSGPPWRAETLTTSAIAGSGIDLPILVVAALLLLATALCFWGLSPAYYFSAVLSVLMLVFVPGGIQFGNLFVISVVLAAATVVADALAANSKEYVLERDHPMNLPVFG